jgi:multidrug efflux pump subunit AcrB
MSPSKAALEASRKRFRPIFITTATTLAGMLPLLFEKSLQAQILQPLVISLTFGLASATILILFFLPCLYAMKEDFQATPG